MRTLVIGARGSRLSLRQVELVCEALRAAHPGIALDVREIHTEGDRSSAPLSQIGGTGVFTKAIEDALLACEIDIAIHSMKDLPARVADGLTVASVPRREDVRDALVTRTGGRLESLPAGARIGTGSERRAVMLRAMRGDVVTAEIRGNVDTRIRKVEQGEYDATVLAMAGLSRLGLSAKVAQVFEPEEMLPAVGQAALAIETRADDDEAIDAARAIEHAETRAAVDAERAFLERLGAGCRLPVGAWATVSNGQLWLRAMVAHDGEIRRAQVRGAAADAVALGVSAADAVGAL
jgi:hydroxymethylbilane synthase